MTIRVAFPFVGDTIGGSHVSAALLMAELGAFGFSPVALVHRDGPLAPWLAAQAIEMVRADLPFLPEGAAGVAALARLGAMAPRHAAVLRRERLALVHANDGRMIASWMPAAKLAGIAAIAHRRTRWTRSRLAHISLLLADRIIAISDYVRDGMPPGLQRRTTVIANPFNTAAQSRAAGRQAILDLMKSDSDAPVMGFVGTLQEQKRPLVFLRAAQAIRQRRPDVRFLMMGRDGDQAAAVRALARELGLADAVNFAGFRTDVALLLAGCDMLLAPAVNEGHGRALIEAMVSDVPVIAAASGGHLAAVQEGATGMLVPADDVQALAGAALDLLGDPARAGALGMTAGAWARQEFSPVKHAAAVAGVYRAALQA